MTPRVIASRSSATFLPEKSSGALDAAAAAPAPALRAPLAAVCCRPRALPPAFAARLRAGVLADDEPDLRADEPELEDLRAVDDFRAVELALERRLDDALLDDFRAVEPALDDLRAVDAPPDLRAVDLRAVEPELEDLRAVDDPERDPPPDLRPEDEPPPLPPVDSAISFPPQEASCPQTRRAAPHYLMPSAHVTYA